MKLKKTKKQSKTMHISSIENTMKFNLSSYKVLNTNIHFSGFFSKIPVRKPLCLNANFLSDVDPTKIPFLKLFT